MFFKYTMFRAEAPRFLLPEATLVLCHSSRSLLLAGLPSKQPVVFVELVRASAGSPGPARSGVLGNPGDDDGHVLRVRDSPTPRLSPGRGESHRGGDAQRGDAGPRARVLSAIAPG